MKSVREAFSAPFNWCDRRCERCPLADECPVQRRERQRRWVHEARGRDPDDPAVFLEDMAEDLESTMRMVREVAAEEGIDLNAPLPPRVFRLDAERLRRASMRLVECLVERSRAGNLQADDATLELRSLSTTLASKVGRIAGYLDDTDVDEVWAADAVPNLLLLDRLKRRFAEDFARISDGGEFDARVTRALADLDRLLDPLIAEVGEPARALLAGLEERGAAPSPFCDR